MNDFMKRIARLKKKLNIVDPVLITLFYMDGTSATMSDDAAVMELFTRCDVRDVMCASEGIKSFLVAMLPGCDCSNMEDDSWMIDEGLI